MTLRPAMHTDNGRHLIHDPRLVGQSAIGGILSRQGRALSSWPASPVERGFVRITAGKLYPHR
jgi:hypothetical protein